MCGRLASGLTAGIGLMLVVGAAVGMAHDRRAPRGFGSTSAPIDRAAQLPQPRPRVDRGRVPSVRPAPPPAAPAALAVPALQLTATVVPVLASDGELGVPTDPAQVGWWAGSALPGAPSGSVVIDGHVDSAATGPGALFRLTDLRTGDQLVVTTTAGDRRGYVVTGRRVYVKTGGLPADLFAADGPPRLVLITCGGPFDRSAGSYLDNIVVFAAPA